MLGWLIYGYVLFFSDSNNCDNIVDTALLNSIMFVILFIGYILIFMYMMLLCTFPCVYFFADPHQNPQHLRQPHQAPQRSQIPSILASLSKTNYDPNKFKHETQCVICLIEYSANDIVT